MFLFVSNNNNIISYYPYIHSYHHHIIIILVTSIGCPSPHGNQKQGLAIQRFAPNPAGPSKTAGVDSCKQIFISLSKNLCPKISRIVNKTNRILLQMLLVHENLLVHRADMFLNPRFFVHHDLKQTQQDSVRNHAGEGKSAGEESCREQICRFSP